MPFSFRILAPLVSIAAASALAANAAPFRSSAWFEPSDSGNSRWVVRAPQEQAELSGGALKLAGRTGDVLNVRLIGASKSAIVRGEQALAARSFHFHGNDPLKWRGAVPHFTRARTVAVYPGIDAVYYQGPHGLEADFIASPGSDYRRIQFQFVNHRIALDAQGNLCDKTSGEILMAAPSAYEIGVQGDRTPVRSRFRIVAADRASFRVEHTDLSRTLVIDPILSYATYLGGSGGTTITAIERGSDGRVYVAGNTTSVDLPQAVSLDSFLIRPTSIYLRHKRLWSATVPTVLRWTMPFMSAEMGEIWPPLWRWIRKAGRPWLAIAGATIFPPLPQPSQRRFSAGMLLPTG